MKSEIHFTDDSGSKALSDLKKSIDDPDIIFLYPTTLEISTNGLGSISEGLEDEFDCPVIGVSVGAIATHQSEGIKTRGISAVSLENVDFNLERVEDVWDIDDVEFIGDKYSSAITFESGSRGARDTKTWNIAQGLVKQIISNTSRMGRDILLEKIENSLRDNQMGYPDFYLERVRQIVMEDKKIINFNSGDTGDFLKGYEIYGSEMTESKSASIVMLDEEPITGQFHTAKETLQSDRVIESFDELESAGRLYHTFDGKSISDLKKEYPVVEKIGQGGFAYYIIFETSDNLYSTAIGSDLGVVVSYLPTEVEIQKAHLARAPSFDQYLEKCRSELDKLKNGAHISVNPPQMNFYQGRISELVEEADRRMDQYIITVDNALRGHKYPQYIFPNYIVYD